MPAPPSPVAIVVVAKAPRAGHSKTRLCPPCDPEQAASLAEAALAETLQTVATTPATRRVLVLDGPVGAWLPDGFEVVRQVDGELDARLAAATLAVDGPFVLIGMDTPQVAAHHLEDAAALLQLDEIDAVLGPAVDGGWWAAGLRRPDPMAFRGVRTSRPTTGADQLERFRRLGLRTALLPVLRDVDHWADAQAVADLTVGSRFHREVMTIGSGALA